MVGNVRNTADHADIVELGRSASTAKQTFASAKAAPLRALTPGDEALEARRALIRARYTRARPGQHILEDALEDAASAVLGVGAARRASIGDVIPSRFI